MVEILVVMIGESRGMIQQKNGKQQPHQQRLGHSVDFNHHHEEEDEGDQHQQPHQLLHPHLQSPLVLERAMETVNEIQTIPHQGDHDHQRQEIQILLLADFKARMDLLLLPPTI
jgi:hypothetical protein